VIVVVILPHPLNHGEVMLGGMCMNQTRRGRGAPRGLGDAGDSEAESTDPRFHALESNTDFVSHI
jgi:hypothetical protein